MACETNPNTHEGMCPSPTGKAPSQTKAPPSGAPSLKENIKPDPKGCEC